jgi:hypothetical protein
MKNKHGSINWFLSSIFILAVSLAATSCDVRSPAAPSDGGAENTGSLSLALGGAARTARPSDATSYTVVSYRITGSGPASQTFDSGTITSVSYQRSGLATGSWTITVQGMNANGHVIAQKAISMTISQGATTTAIVTMDRQAGDGTLDLAVNWYASGEYDTVSGTLTPVGGTAQAISFTVSGTQATYAAALPAADYLLNVNLVKAAVVLDTVTEVIQVYEGYTTQTSYLRAISAAPATFAYTSANPVYPVAFNGASSLNLTVTGAAGRSVYLVKANTGTAAVASASAGSASSVKDVVSYEKSLTMAEPVYQGKQAGVERREHAESAAFNAAPPPLPASDAGKKGLPGIDREEARVNYGSPDPAFTVDSTTKTFWVENAVGTWVSITATLRAVGQYCYIWVDNARYSAGSAVDNDNLITSAQAQALRNKFDGNLANSYNDGIFKNVTNIFGYEYGGGSSSADGGRDTDQHIAVLVYDVDYDFVSTQTGGVLGYFWGKDYYSQADLTSMGSTLKTNYCEMFYVDTHFTDKYPNVIISTLAHEFQHMINFNQKYLVQSVSSVPTWYNEMCSMVAEDLVMANIGLDPVAYGSIDRLNSFAYHYAESGVSDWLSGNDVLKSYASAFAFGAFLERNYGGATLFKNILANNTAGEASITAALATGGYTDTFADAFNKYGQTLVFTDPPAGSNVSTLKKTTTATIGSISYAPVSIDYATIQQYNMSLGWVSGAFGPRTYAPSATVALRPYGNSVHTQPTWQTLAGNLSINLTAPTDAGVLFYIMVK